MGGEQQQQNSEVIIIPAPAVGHLVSTGELAKRLLSHSSRFSHVTLLLIKPLKLASQLDAYTTTLTDPRITCLSLPVAPPPPLHLLSASEEYFYTLLIEAYAPHVRSTLEGKARQGQRKPAALVMDFFCSSFADIANELEVPYYIYHPSGAAFLNLMLYLPTRGVNREFTHSDADVLMPGFMNPVPPRVLPTAVFNTQGGYTAFMKMARKFRECKGIIVNTFLDIESYALSSLAEDKDVPPIYPVGPLIDLKGEGQKKMGYMVTDLGQVGSPRIRILEWLDKHPSKSVVFLCFGSKGEFREPQIKEIATGLEQSGHRFLWSFRGPEGCDVAELLPQGFAERTRGRGMVCGWAPQVDILAHGAIGGFVSHCGWNSIIESVWNGVPVATWPMYAEQQLNAFMLVKELGVAVELRMDFRKNGEEVVAAEEVEAAVREVMKQESAVRDKVEELKEKGRAALEQDGSSFNTIGQLVDDMLSSEVF